MCVTFFGLDTHPDFPFWVAFNRDEYFDRASASAHIWPNGSSVVGGRDLERGGTWLGIRNNGRVAFLTNYKGPPEIAALDSMVQARIGPVNRSAYRSRGELTVNFLNGTQTPYEYVRETSARRTEYRGFSLVVGCIFPANSSRELCYLTNSNDQPNLAQLRRVLHLPISPTHVCLDSQRQIYPPYGRLRPGRVYGFSNDVFMCGEKVWLGLHLINRILNEVAEEKESELERGRREIIREEIIRGEITRGKDEKSEGKKNREMREIDKRRDKSLNWSDKLKMVLRTIYRGNQDYDHLDDFLDPEGVEAKSEDLRRRLYEEEEKEQILGFNARCEKGPGNTGNPKESEERAAKAREEGKESPFARGEVEGREVGHWRGREGRGASKGQGANENEQGKEGDGRSAEGENNGVGDKTARELSDYYVDFDTFMDLDVCLKSYSDLYPSGSDPSDEGITNDVQDHLPRDREGKNVRQNDEDLYRGDSTTSLSRHSVKNDEQFLGPHDNAIVPKTIFVDPFSTSRGLYGTRSQTVITLDNHGSLILKEDYLCSDKVSWEVSMIKLQLRSS